MAGNAKSIKDGAMPLDSTMVAISADDMSFLFECLKNPVGGGAITIDTNAVAAVLNYSNPGSVTNRIARLKKRYNLPITATSSKKVNANPAGEIATPVTPAKNKVTKARATRGRAAKTPKKVLKSEDESAGEDNGLATAAPKKVGKFAAAVSGKSGDNEDGNLIHKGKGKGKAKMSSDFEEVEVSEYEEDDDEMEKAGILKYENDEEEI